jgi:hypothetical protein
MTVSLAAKSEACGQSVPYEWSAGSHGWPARGSLTELLHRTCTMMLVGYSLVRLQYSPTGWFASHLFRIYPPAFPASAFSFLRSSSIVNQSKTASNKPVFIPSPIRSGQAQLSPLSDQYYSSRFTILMRLISSLPGKRIQSATLKAVQQHISLRYVSSGPTALTQEEISASVNKLSQETPFPWEQVRYIIFVSVVVSIWLRRFFSQRWKRSPFFNH